MARVIQPVHPRSYNPNPRGSSTTTVLMRAHNPFEQKTRLVARRASPLPGMGDFDINAYTVAAGQAAAAGQPAPAPTTGVDWGSVATSGLQTGINILGTAGQNIVNKLVPAPVTTMTAPQPVLLPGLPGAGAPGTGVYYPVQSKMSPMLIIGGVGALGLIAFFALRKKKR